MTALVHFSEISLKHENLSNKRCGHIYVLLRSQQAYVVLHIIIKNVQTSCQLHIWGKTVYRRLPILTVSCHLLTFQRTNADLTPVCPDKPSDIKVHKRFTSRGKPSNPKGIFRCLLSINSCSHTPVMTCQETVGLFCYKITTICICRALLRHFPTCILSILNSNLHGVLGFTTLMILYS